VDKATLELTGPYKVVNLEPGAAVLRTLAAAGIDVSAACWLLPVEGYWDFMVVSKTADDLGMLAANQKASAVLEAAGLPLAQRGQLTIRPTNDSVGKDLLEMTARARRGEPWYRDKVGWHLVEELHLYTEDFSHPANGSVTQTSPAP
jgi:hypothetical protein